GTAELRGSPAAGGPPAPPPPAARTDGLVVAVDDVLGDRIVVDHLHDARALDLAAGGLGNGARAHEDHARRPVPARAMHAARDLADEIVEVVAPAILAAHLGDDV